MDNSFFLKQLDEIIQDYNKLKAKAVHSDLSGNTTIEEITSVLTKAKATVVRITGLKSEYYKDIESILERKSIYVGNQIQFIIGTIQALKSDIQNGYLKSLNDLIQSEVFSDYLEMAEHLLKEGYKDPAAVLTGSTLEAHIRELCKINSIDTEIVNSKQVITPKKADLMNSDLAKAGVYSILYQKQIIAWLGIRNSAAHGKYSEYTKEEVDLMLQGIRQFILSTK